ncbi:MAG: hypothetical protein IID13_07970 [Candidatus Marinimicrobia bacterium]|nr:hypothetical protein [Candidatus Neomarinimicrobiota bacterium]
MTSLTTSIINRAREINGLALVYCQQQGNGIKPKDLMPFLVQNGIFPKVDDRNGKPLRDVLRAVDDAGQLGDLMPNVVVDRKLKNRYWSFSTEE